MREAMTIDRSLEFYSEGELSKQLGYLRDGWPLVALAELVDNSLDHLEEIGRLPEIHIVVDRHTLSVSDNGDGMPEAVVDSLGDFSSRSSSRLYYKTPTRGQQGNASLCLVALPYVWSGGSGGVTITAGGSKYRTTCILQDGKPVATIEKVQLARSGTVDTPCSQSHPNVQKVELEEADAGYSACCVEGDAELSNVPFGTTVTLDLPGISDYGLIVDVVEKYALLNPHATFHLECDDEYYNWCRTVSKIKRMTAGKPEPVSWYTLSEFHDRIRHTVESGKLVSEALREFAGFRRSDARAAVIAQSGATRTKIAEIASDPLKVRSLYDAMRSESAECSPSAVGMIGKKHVEYFMSQVSHQGISYKRIAGLAGNIPYVVEAAFAAVDGEEGRRLFTGINGAADAYYPCAQSILKHLASSQVEDDHSVYVMVHVFIPSPRFLNRGKTQIELPPEVEVAVGEAIEHVCRVHLKERKALERDEAAALKRSKRRDREGSYSLTEAVKLSLDEAIDKASHQGSMNFSARNLYYAIRPLVQRYTDAELSQQYFDHLCNKIELEQGIIELRLRDPRGYLLEPHTGRQIPLGTKSVSDYEIPDHRYHTILYVEKKGLLPNFQLGKIAERYDAAIVCAEGFPVRACQALLQAAANKGCRVLCFHDADPAGYGIADALGRDSAAHKFNYSVIDAGLTIDEALEMGLPTETFTRHNALPERLKFSDTARKMFTGTRSSMTSGSGKQVSQWVNCQRVELNALAADPERFVDWVEAKLAQHGVTEKLVPSVEVQRAEQKRLHSEQIADELRGSILSAIGFEGMLRDIQDELSLDDGPDLAAWAIDCPPEPWTKPVNRFVTEQVEEAKDRIDELVEDRLNDLG